MEERKVITPTIRTLLNRKAHKREDLFVLVPVVLLERVASLGTNASFLFAILYSIHRMQPKTEYFLMQSEFEAAVGRGRKWWHRHVRTLEEAGLIEVRRSAGSKPRFRMLVDANGGRDV